MPSQRNYGRSFDDMADPSIPLVRLKHVEYESKSTYTPPATKRTSSSRTTLCTKPKSYQTYAEPIEFEDGKDRKITQRRKEVNIMSQQNKQLRGDNKQRARTIKALEKLMVNEKAALEQVLEAARAKVYALRDENAELADQAAVERDHRLHVQEEQAAVAVNNRTQMQVFEKHVHELSRRARDATLDAQLTIQKGENERAAQTAHFEGIMSSLREQTNAAEQRFGAEKSALVMANSRLRSLMRIWQEIIVDLRHRCAQLSCWSWGFRMWHFNAMWDIEARYEDESAMLEGYDEQYEQDVKADLDDFDPGSLDVHAYAKQFGL